MMIKKPRGKGYKKFKFVIVQPVFERLLGITQPETVEVWARTPEEAETIADRCIKGLN